MPAGTGITEAYHLLVNTGLIPPIPEETAERNREYARFHDWVKGCADVNEHLIATGKWGKVAITNAEIETAILKHVVRVGTQTVRALFYAMLGLKLVRNGLSGYQQVGDILIAMRERWEVSPETLRALDPDLIVDETTVYDGYFGGRVLADYIARFRNFWGDPWSTQPVRVEIWIEKATIMPLLRDLFNDLYVRALPTHGFLKWGGARQIAKQIAKRGQKVLVLYLGDFDPSGLLICDLDGSGQIRTMMEARLLGLNADPSLFTIRRLGLTLEDTRSPEICDLWVPVKGQAYAEENDNATGDTRAPAYIEQHGDRCWEIDALAAEPERLIARIRTAVEAERKLKVWKAALADEDQKQSWCIAQAARMTTAARKLWP